jgi:hypothetical protein
LDAFADPWHCCEAERRLRLVRFVLDLNLDHCTPFA